MAHAVATTARLSGPLSIPLPYLATWLLSTATSPGVTLRRRSWDFVPPDIIRPSASSAVGDIIALAHRLGIVWLDVRPGEDIMRAKGCGQTLASTVVRGFGIIFQYTRNEVVARKAHPSIRQNCSIPIDEADRFGFGIIPGCRSFKLPDLSFTDQLYLSKPSQGLTSGAILLPLSLDLNPALGLLSSRAPRDPGLLIS